MKQKMQRFEIIDFLKGYSIFTIVMFHYLQFLQLPDPYSELISFGGTGIHLFILLSGFGLYYSYINKPLSYITFLKRRFSKIYVPYIFIVLLSALISIFIPVYKNSLYALGGHVFLYKMFDNSIMGSYGYPLWFISMILQFYLSFHIIIWLKSKFKNKLFLISSVLISLSWALIVYLTDNESVRVWNSFFLQYYWEFALGIIIAERIVKKQKLTDKKINQFLLLVIALVNCALYGFLALEGGSWGKLFNDFFALIAYSLLAVFIFNLNIKLLNKIFLFIGSISLSVYLLHILVLLTLANLFDFNPIYIVLLSLIILFPLSVLYQKLVNIFFKISKL